jgi:hypothetical protein
MNANTIICLIGCLSNIIGPLFGKYEHWLRSISAICWGYILAEFTRKG